MHTYEVYLTTKAVANVQATSYSTDKKLKRLLFHEDGKQTAETWFAADQVIGVNKIQGESLLQRIRDGDSTKKKK
jgi:hypothetical protein